MITTHVLDTARGKPAAGVPVVLEQSTDSGDWRRIGNGETDADGRLRTLVASDVTLPPRRYRLVFDTGRYFGSQGVRSFYPHVIIVFETTPNETHYHVPLLLSPFGYSTYRGS